jgi:thiamine pyrophosphokinase
MKDRDCLASLATTTNHIIEELYPNITNNPSIIIANGDLPRNDYLLNLLKTATPLICCDGAIDKLITQHIEPQYIIGDCDSMTPNAKARYHDRMNIIPTQDINDLTKAVHFAHDKLKLNNLIILGATGLREDHTLANISLLAQYIKLISNICIISDHGIFTAHAAGKTNLATLKGQQLSFFTLNPNTILNCNELKWQLINHKFANWFNGTLNQATHNSITVISNDDIIIFRAFEGTNR